MVNENQELRCHNSNIPGVLLGVLLGGLAGALTMLLLAPKSGEDTRVQIHEKGIQLRDRTTGIMHDAVGQMRLKRSKITISRRQKPQDFLHRGQLLVVRQLDHVSGAALAGKNAIQSS